MHVLWLRLECLSELISDSLSQVYLIKIFHFLEFSNLLRLVLINYQRQGLQAP